MTLFKKILFLLVFLIGSFVLNAQTPTIQDCAGAIPVCQGIYEQTNSFENSGNFPNEVNPNTCLTAGEINSVWYVFTVAEDGMLSFILTPNDPQDDYDWALFNISENDCSEIFNTPSMMVSCNSYGLAAPMDNGPTGMSTAEGGIGDSNGPGDIGYVPFNADIQVEAGDTYVLMVEDWENDDNISTGTGYTLDFTNTTATIYDDSPPVVESVELECNQFVTLTFSEPIECTSINSSDFLLVDEAGTEFVPINFFSDCTNIITSTTVLTLVFDADLTSEGELFTLFITDLDENVSDFCGNTVVATEYTFVGEFFEVPDFTLEDIGTCPGASGILLAPEGLNPDNFNWVWSTGETTSTITVEETGTYTFSASNDCFTDDNTLDVVIAPVPSFTGQTLCGLQAEVDDAQPQIDGVWSISPSTGVTLSDNTSNFTSISVSDYGSYSFTFTDACQSSGSFNIVFASVPIFSIDSKTFCFEDGEPLITPVGPNLDLNTWLWNDGSTLMSNTVAEDGLLTLIGTNDCGSSSDTAAFVFLPCELTIPNVFTPNGDHNNESFSNDSFQIMDITKFPGSQLQIFNRWGNVIYSSDNYQNDWAPSGSEVADGSYYYILKQKFPDGTFENFAGYITILR